MKKYSQTFSTQFLLQLISFFQLYWLFQLRDITSPFKAWPTCIPKSSQLQHNPTHFSIWCSEVFPDMISSFWLWCELAYYYYYYY